MFPQTLTNTGYPHDFPEKMILEVKEGYKDHKQHTKVPFYAFQPPEMMSQTKFITAVILVNKKNQNNLPKIECIQGVNWEGVRIKQDGEVTNVYLNLLADGRHMGRNANNTINGWQTDAYLMAFTYPENSEETNLKNVSRYFIANGSYLRKKGKTVLNSLSKVFMISKMDESKLNVELQGEPIINANFRTGVRPKEIMLNDKEVKVHYDSEDKSVALDLTDKKFMK